MGPILPGSRMARGHSGFHSWSPLETPGQALSGKGVPSGVGWGLHLQDCSFQQLGAGHTLTSTLDICPWVSAVPCKGPAASPAEEAPAQHWSFYTVEAHCAPAVCWGRGFPEDHAWCLSSRSSGLRVRPVAMVSAVLKVCPEVWSTGRSNLFCVSGVRGHSSHGREVSRGAQTEEAPGGPEWHRDSPKVTWPEKGRVKDEKGPVGKDRVGPK